MGGQVPLGHVLTYMLMADTRTCPVPVHFIDGHALLSICPARHPRTRDSRAQIENRTILCGGLASRTSTRSTSRGPGATMAGMPSATFYSAPRRPCRSRVRARDQVLRSRPRSRRPRNQPPDLPPPSAKTATRSSSSPAATSSTSSKRKDITPLSQLQQYLTDKHPPR